MWTELRGRGVLAWMMEQSTILRLPYVSPRLHRDHLWRSGAETLPLPYAVQWKQRLTHTNTYTLIERKKKTRRLTGRQIGEVIINLMTRFKTYYRMSFWTHFKIHSVWNHTAMTNPVTHLLWSLKWNQCARAMKWNPLWTQAYFQLHKAMLDFW